MKRLQPIRGIVAIIVKNKSLQPLLNRHRQTDILFYLMEPMRLMTKETARASKLFMS
ncbi:hypothetical protein CLOSCI_02768 [[Clostridium] scindens ATCC 35704]|uniref:hypothetical protein n=1 Tax=Clostridium scindens (strain JCM 10418 / VPI 12708) TaxID=29347 RepID=UPI000165555F|nr:hypothetical protein [[Clostridium] scindens]EDS06101.1 hypothetical protein CLOSCI_02768 [[Clostridium] scindens ATCC 35704]